MARMYTPAQQAARALLGATISFSVKATAMLVVAILFGFGAGMGYRLAMWVLP